MNINISEEVQECKIHIYFNIASKECKCMFSKLLNLE